MHQLLRYSFQPVAFVPRWDRAPLLDGRLTSWTERHRLPHWSPDADADLFATVMVAWDPDHLYVAVQVNLRRPPRPNPHRYWTGDCVELFFDLRGKQDYNQFTEHCHHFFVLPPIGPQGTVQVGRCEPGVEHGVVTPQEPAIRAAGESLPQGYRVELAFPRAVLPTYQPERHQEIGFNYLIRDAAGRQQFWSAGLELHTYRDPSTWGILRLMDE